MDALYTIGHSHHELNEFIKLLKIYDINYILDVRSTPYSKYSPQFNQNIISDFLDKNNITYVPMGKFFGARQPDTKLYTSEGYLDFSKMRNTIVFQKAMQSVILGLNRGNRIALMCTEQNPIDCHRTILVSKAFYDINIPVKHILSNGKFQTQNSINEELLDMYFPERGQLSMFDFMKGIPEEKELLEKAYVLRNRDIGYHIDTPSKIIENDRR